MIRVGQSGLFAALTVGAVLVSAAPPAIARCPKSIVGKPYSSQLRLYDAGMNLLNTCLTTNVLERDGVSFPGTGYCTDTAGNRAAYVKRTIIDAEVSDACLQYFEGTVSDPLTGELINTYSGWNITVDNGRTMHSVGSNSLGQKFLDRFELQ